MIVSVVSQRQSVLEDHDEKHTTNTAQNDKSDSMKENFDASNVRSLIKQINDN